ncbi:putative quinol monooxygenase [Chitinophaga sp. SYP-B3965]|uniref:putative quinol monooxygenase n=1 Tax=Chitinophaga sp. SYP-B3965 TaxID=2663120 RepID=UPI0015665A80|nr:antibiotic biosynthesis monooxygenase [Chitinophaga sp. SYP-B3965]
MKRFKIWWLAVLSLIVAGENSLQAQPSDSAVIMVLTHYDVKPPYQQKFRKALWNYVFSSLKADGNIMAEAYYEEGNPSGIWMIERWSSRSFHDENIKSGVAKAILALTKDGLASPVDIVFAEDLEPISKEAYRKTFKIGDQPITIMLFVDAKEGTESVFKSLYHVAMPEFRSEPGVLTYQLSQVSDDKTKFITYEKFRNEAAFQYHLKIPAVEPVIAYLRTSIKEQPFEKGLHRLIEFAPLFREE